MPNGGELHQNAAATPTAVVPTAAAESGAEAEAVVSPCLPKVPAATTAPEAEEEVPIKVDAPQPGSSAAAAETAAAEVRPEEAPKHSGNVDPPKTQAGDSASKVVNEDGKGLPQKRTAPDDAGEKAGAAKAKAKAKADPKAKAQEKASSRKIKT